MDRLLEVPMDKKYDIHKLIASENIAEMLSDNDLAKIGANAKQGFDDDNQSRASWLEKNEEWMKLATQVHEAKNFPWPQAASVKYPLITLAAIQFHARAYPNLVPRAKLVRARVVGRDPNGEKVKRALRISKHMSWQLLQKMKAWEPEMDKTLLIVPITGCVFKKTYYDPIKEQPKSEIILPNDLVVDYNTKTLDEANRVTQILRLNSNDIHSYQAAGLFLDIDISPTHGTLVKAPVSGNQVPKYDPDIGTIDILEQHSWIDLDGDGYKEPYIITLDYASGRVLRIVARYREDNVFVSDKQEVIYIEPIKYFTKFSFIPSPDGGFYDVGFGILLGPLNNTSNTIINQLLDAGTLSNTQGGFLGRGLRLKEGITRFRPGEWKTVNASGNDIRKSVFPLPVREPSGVMFNLLSLLLDAGQRLSSTVDIMVGETPGQNTPATTTLAAIEQGSKVFTAIYKRLYKSLQYEFEKIFNLNYLHLNEEEYFTVLDEGDQMTVESIGVDDYNPNDFDVVPGADPAVAADSMKLAKAQALMELLPMGVINPQETVKRILEAQDHDNIEALIQPPPPPPPDPNLEFEQMKFEQETRFKEMELDIKAKLAEIQRIQVLAQLDKVEAEKELDMAKAHKERSQGATNLHGIVQSVGEKENAIQQQAEEQARMVGPSGDQGTGNPPA